MDRQVAWLLRRLLSLSTRPSWFRRPRLGWVGACFDFLALTGVVFHRQAGCRDGIFVATTILDIGGGAFLAGCWVLYTPDVSSETRPPSSPPHVAPCAPPTRRSARQAVAEDGSIATDEDTMKKAMRRKADMNLDYSGMTSKSSSFISLSTPVISSKLNTVGINLGKNVNEVLISANVLRHMEYDRLTVDPKLRDVVDITELDEEEANATLDGQLLSSLVGVVSEIDFDETRLGSLHELKASGQKSKKSSNKKPSRRINATKSKLVS
jgi:hypothetical protein